MSSQVCLYINYLLLIACTGAGGDLSRSQDMDANGPVGISSLSSARKKSGATLKPTTSGSSREQSEDDENEEETEITENMDPADAKRVRR